MTFYITSPNFDVLRVIIIWGGGGGGKKPSQKHFEKNNTIILKYGRLYKTEAVFYNDAPATIWQMWANAKDEKMSGAAYYKRGTN